jgi:Cytochrome b5-like Heme/Steroid binding domain
MTSRRAVFLAVQFLALSAVAATEPVRVVTKEELARHDGKQSKEYWLSILSEVFDVTAGAADWYEEGNQYNIFIGRDANVPFISGNFTEEDAKKPLSVLTPSELKLLEEYWLKFYQDEERYPFIGYLIGDLYDEEGKTTYTHYEIQEKIDEARKESKAEQQRVRDIVAQRNIEMAEREARERAEREPKRETDEIYYVIGPWTYRRTKKPKVQAAH